MNLTRSFVGTAVIFCCLASFALAQVDEAVVARIRAGNAASVASLRTLHVRFTAVQANKARGGGAETGVTTSVEWWQDGKKIRWVQEMEYTHPKKAVPGKGAKPILPIVIRAEGVVTAEGEVKIRNMQRSADGKWHLATGDIRRSSRQDILAVDPWSSALLYINHAPLATLADLLDDPKRVLECKAVETDGRKRYRLRIEAATGLKEFDVDVDPGLNYLVCRTSSSSKSPKGGEPGGEPGRSLPGAFARRLLPGRSRVQIVSSDCG